MKDQFFSLLHWKKYLHSIKVSFVVLLIFNLLYLTLGFSTILFFSQGISALFSTVGLITFFVPVVAYSYVTWNIIHKHQGTALDSGIAAVILSLLVFAATELVGFTASSLISLNIVPESVISTALRTHFAEQFLNPINVLLGLIFGVSIAFIGGFFGFIVSEIQSNFLPRTKSILLDKEHPQSRTERTKSLAKDIKIFAVLRTKKSLKHLKAYLKHMVYD